MLYWVVLASEMGTLLIVIAIIINMPVFIHPNYLYPQIFNWRIGIKMITDLCL